MPSLGHVINVASSIPIAAADRHNGYDFTEPAQMISWRDSLQHAPALEAVKRSPR